MKFYKAGQGPALCNTCGGLARACECQFNNWSLCKACQAQITWCDSGGKKIPANGHILKPLSPTALIHPRETPWQAGYTRHNCQQQQQQQQPAARRPWVAKPKAVAHVPATYDIQVWANYGHPDAQLLEVVSCATSAQAHAWLQSGGYGQNAPGLWTDGIDWAYLPGLAVAA